jgi:hypothetical protein
MSGMQPEGGKAPRGRGRGGARWLDILLAKLPTMATPELRQLWASSQNSEAPSLPEPLLRRLLAQRLQEHRHGGLPKPVARELQNIARGDAPVRAPVASLPAGPGTRLIREWNGQTINVEVREDGYLWQGRLYTSLSRIACEVTGARWSGPRFFGLSRHG